MTAEEQAFLLAEIREAQSWNRALLIYCTIMSTAVAVMKPTLFVLMYRLLKDVREMVKVGRSAMFQAERHAETTKESVATAITDVRKAAADIKQTVAEIPAADVTAVVVRPPRE